MKKMNIVCMLLGHNLKRTGWGAAGILKGHPMYMCHRCWVKVDVDHRIMSRAEIRELNYKEAKEMLEDSIPTK